MLIQHFIKKGEATDLTSRGAREIPQELSPLSHADIRSVGIRRATHLWTCRMLIANAHGLEPMSA